MFLNELTAAEYVSQTAASAGHHEKPGRILLALSRMRFQLILGMVFTVAAPALLRAIFEPTSDIAIEFDKSLFGTICAFLLGYLLFRKVTGYPGVRAAGYILPVFMTSYGLTFITFFFLRLEYSRLQFLLSFLAAVALFCLIFILVRRVRTMQLSVVPFGDIAKLSTLKFVNWQMLGSPDDVATGAGIVADLRADLPPEWERAITDRALRGVPVYDAKQVFESLSGRVQVEHLSENTFAALSPNSIYAASKRYVDFSMALIALALVWPLILLAALLIRVESPGPGLFRQERMGYRGKTFTVFKLRTMKLADAADDKRDTQMTQASDPRITRIGAFLRKTRIDELPQIINILRGEMSWIGPRPEALKPSALYESRIPFYRYRHLVRPGITGWAQVTQGHVTSVADADLKLQYDFFYVKNFSLWLDIMIVLKTIRVVFTGSGAK